MTSIIPREAVRAAYVAQQRTLLFQCLAAHRVLRKVSGFELEPAPRSVRALRRRYARLLNQDLANVEQGFYPRELLFQLPVADYVRLFPKLFTDFPRIIRRAQQKNYRDLPGALDLGEYPAYYQRNFHWQTDGYLSRHSAELYDVGVELLFLGTADVMRRQIIPPIARWLARRQGPDENARASARARVPARDRARVLDVACGTGSALRQLAGAYPGLKYFGLDLSPFYVDFARERLKHVRDLTVVAENAESMPFRDGYFDVVTSVYLFHELPRNARHNVLREMFRVLRPGGLLVIEDSAQVSEGAEVQIFLERFADDFHEPFYRDYLTEDLAVALENTGFTVESTDPCFVSKLVVARKPE